MKKLISVLLFSGLSLPAIAEESLGDQKVQAQDWQYQLTPYFAYGNVVAEVELDRLKNQNEALDDFVDQDEFSYGYYLEGHSETWGFTHEVFYVESSDTINGPTDLNLAKINTDMSQLMFDIAASYRFESYGESFISFGLRYIDAELDSVFIETVPQPIEAPEVDDT